MFLVTVCKKTIHFSLLIGLFCVQTGMAQIVVDTTYLDEQFRAVSYSKEPAFYYRVSKKNGLFTENGEVITYYMNGQKAIVEYSLRQQLHGDRLAYWTNGQLKSQVTYHRGLRSGTEVHWHRNGQKMSEIEFLFMNNRPEERLYSHWDSTGYLMVDGGFGKYKSYHDNGRVHEYGAYRNGLKHGVWGGFDSKGRRTHITSYNRGEVKTKETFDTQGKLTSQYPRVNEGIVEATFPGGPRAWTKYLSKNLRYPTEASRAGIEGKVTLKITIEADGQVTNVKVMEPVHPSLDNEAVRVVRNSKFWNPATKNGKPVTSELEITLSFLSR